MKIPTSSKEFREQVVWRSSFNSSGSLEIPLVKKQELISSDIDLISYSDIKANDNTANTRKGVHFFVDDPRFDGIYRNPDRSLKRVAQYAFVLTPDNSLYSEMGIWEQIANVGKSRWVGAYWQSKGLTVYPTVSWGLPRTYGFSFEGVEHNAPVAVGMVGCKTNKIAYLRGYNAMLDYLNPSAVICFGAPFSEMEGITVVVDYMASRKKVR